VRVTEICTAPDGTPYAIADGELYCRSPITGTKHQHLPPGLRPLHEWRKVECPYGPTRVMVGNQDALWVRALGTLWERTRNPDYLGPQQVQWLWKEVTIGEPNE